jgi:hypothetical protein
MLKQQLVDFLVDLQRRKDAVYQCKRFVAKR